MTRAMILAAGFGTRLGTLSEERPKPLLPLCDIALIRYALALLVGHGVRDIVINVHHLGRAIEDELGDGGDGGARIAYSREPTILGTGGGLRRALPLLGDEPFLVVNGKIVIDLDLGEVMAAHQQSGALATLVVRPDPAAQTWGAIDAPADGGAIRSILGTGDHMFTGVHVIAPELIARLADQDTPQCIVKQGYLPWLAQGDALNAYVTRGYFMEHSTPERYWQGTQNLLSRVVMLAHPPGELTGVHPRARVAASARLFEPVRVGADAVIGAGALIGPGTVVGARATVAPSVALDHAIVWPDVVVTQSATRAILTAKTRWQV